MEALTVMMNFAKLAAPIIAAIGHGVLSFLEGAGGPLLLATIGAKASLFGIVGTYLNPELKQRKTRYASSTAATAISVVGILLMVGVIAAPAFLLPILFCTMLLSGISAESYILKKAREDITTSETALSALKESYSQKKDSATLTKIAAQQYQLETKKINTAFAAVRRNLSVVSLIGVGLFVGSLFFPPLAIGAIAIFIGLGITNMVYKYKERNQLKELNDKYADPRKVEENIKKEMESSKKASLKKSLSHPNLYTLSMQQNDASSGMSEEKQEEEKQFVSDSTPLLVRLRTSKENRFLVIRFLTRGIHQQA